jgi:hypothetical protein
MELVIRRGTRTQWVGSTWVRFWLVIGNELPMNMTPKSGAAIALCADSYASQGHIREFYNGLDLPCKLA